MQQRNDTRCDDNGVESATSRRSVLARTSQLLMGTGLVAAYGTFTGYLARFLYPAHETPTGWMFVEATSRFGRGEAILFETPAGATVNIARQGDGTGVGDFIALSSTCPHLGCQVHWEAANARFFCPCHNGAFDPTGRAIAGPPAEAGQSLSSYPLRVSGGLLFIEVPQSVLAMGPGRILERGRTRGAGHDPCLARAGREATHGGATATGRA
jgi:Rieske Fe-S protein